MKQNPHAGQLITALLLSSLMAIPTRALAEERDKTPSRSTAVTVSNSTANPVPVTGSVGVTGALTINNAEANPVPVVVIASPSQSFQPVNGSCSLGRLGIGMGMGCSLYKVPAGKRLVVETVSFNLELDANAIWQRVMIGQCDTFQCDVGASPNFYALGLPVPNAFPGNPSSGSSMVHEYSLSQPLRIYLDENLELEVIVKGLSPGPDYSAIIFSGYLMDK